MDIVASPINDDVEPRKPPELPPRPPPDSLIYEGSNIATTEPRDAYSDPQKPPLLKHVSSPAYSSPLRHHRRNPSTPHQVKETLNARSEYLTSQDDGSAEHRINQYVIKQEIGRGSFGAVHVALDQYGNEYAVKEFSKSRLRKRAQSHILRRPRSQRRRGALQGFNSPLHRQTGELGGEEGSALDLIKEEIAIMKKLNHPNLVRLIEVLDDPTEDSLYMVMEMCKKGVVMSIDLSLESKADPYPDDTCRLYFRDLILGIEYLHAQGIVHRDIKPDNCLITSDDVLKVVDFGVSEMFEKDSEMRTAKSAGSPAFLPPELCVAKHGDVSGRAADIWSMGVTLYCLKYGQIPFQKHQILDLYEAIREQTPVLNHELDVNFVDLMMRILEKDPAKRIKMHDLRNHPWVTKNGADPLLNETENTSDMIEPPTDAEVDAAITGNMRNLMTVVKAVQKFRSLTVHTRPPTMTSILGDDAQTNFSLPPGQLPQTERIARAVAQRSQSDNLDDRQAIESALVTEGVHRDLSGQYLISPYTQVIKRKPVPGQQALPSTPEADSDDEDDEALARIRSSLQEDGGSYQLPPFRSSIYNARTVDDVGRRGHAHDPLEDILYLRIGPSTFSGHSVNEGESDSFMPEDDTYMVSESPGAADVDIYETAYRDEIERILAQAHQQDREPQVYLTRRVDEKLMQLSGLAGKLMAHGEEAKTQLKDATQFSARRARVTEVSRALREAARDEYEKRRQERKAWIESAKAERARMAEQGGTTPSSESTIPSIFSSAAVLTPKQLETTNAWKAKAVDRGRNAKTSFLGLVDTMKKSRNK